MNPAAAIVAVVIMLAGTVAYLLLKRIVAIGGKAERTVIEHKRAVFGDDWPRYRVTHRRQRKQHRDVLRWRKRAS